MSTVVKVHMNICDKLSKITVSTNENGNYDVHIASSCPNVKEFAEGLMDLTMKDLTDKMNSRIIDRYREVSMSATCSVPSGVLNAAWVEAGLIARSLARKQRENVIEFVVD